MNDFAIHGKMMKHLHNANDLIAKAESKLVPGQRVNDVETTLVKAQLELMKALVLATQAAIEVVVMPQRVMFMEDL